MARKIAFINEKGGSCKTTLSTNTAAYFAARMGKKVLLVDMDPQGQVGKSFGVDVRSLDMTVMDLLTNPGVKVRDVVMPSEVENLDLICSNKALTDFAVTAAADSDRVNKLANKLKGLQGYDYVIFDSPPSLGLLTVNIMLATKEIVIPVSMTFLALDGCAEIIETVEMVKENYGNRDLKVVKIVPTLYRHTRLAEAILSKIRAHFPDQAAKTVLGLNVSIDEAQSFGQTIWDYAPSSPGARMLEEIAKEIV